MRPALNQWSPELELLARLSRIAPTADDEARARELSDGPVDWHRVLRLAAHHGVAPLADSAASRFDLASMPAEFRARLHQEHLASVRGDLARYHAWLELCRAFESRGITAMTLRGFHVALSIYGRVGLRPAGDLDFLVRRRDVAAAIGVLQEMGYPPWPDWQASLDHVGLDHLLKSTYEMGFLSPRGIDVDLHWEAGPHGSTPPADELMATGERIRVEGQEVLVPAPDATMTLLVLHGDKSAWARLRWLVDVAEGIDRMSPDAYAATVRRLEALGKGRALANALQLGESLWGRRPARCGQRRPASGGGHRGMLRYSAMAMERAQDWYVIHDRWRPFRMLRDRMGRAPSLRQALAEAFLPNYFDWAYAALPRPFRLGYYAVRPFRVARQALAKRAVATGGSPPPAAVPLTFVTAIYGSGPADLIGGRGRGIAHYLPSLINIANLGAPIVVYCPPDDARAVEDAIAPYFRQYRVVPFELSAFEHFGAVMEWKRTYWKDLRINDRNEVLCFLKSYWVQDAIVRNPFGHDRYFWIDAGLTHHGIFPERVGGVELFMEHPASRYYPQNPANIFTPALGARLAKAAPRGKVLFFAHPFHGSPAPRDRYEALVAAKYGRPREGVRIEDHLVGGLFGGHAEDLKRVHGLYAEVLAVFIEMRSRTLEEQVFSSVRALHPSLFSLQRFGTWHFHSAGERTSVLDAEGDSFYKAVLRVGS